MFAIILILDLRSAPSAGVLTGAFKRLYSLFGLDTTGSLEVPSSADLEREGR
jgi:hypothetical protein